MSDLQTQLTDNTEKISQYLGQVAAYMDTGSGTLPSFEDLVESLGTDMIISMIHNLSAGAQGSATGTLQEQLQYLLAIIREQSLVSLTKGQIYDLASGEMTLEAEKNSADMAKTLNYIRGKSPNQGVTL